MGGSWAFVDGRFFVLFFNSLFSLLPSPRWIFASRQDLSQTRNPDGSEAPKMEDTRLCLLRGSKGWAQLTNPTLKRFLFL